MPHEIRGVAAAESAPAAALLPRQLIETAIELLRQEHPSAKELDGLLDQLAESLDRSFASSNSSLEDALQRAPWLTADVERLKQQQATLRQSLQALRMLEGSSGDSNETARELTLQFDDFATFYLEHEAATQNLLHEAFPGPDWTAQS